MANKIRRAWSIEDLRQHARRQLPKAVFDLFDGGSEDELTLRDNRKAWERITLRPRVLVDVRSVKTSCQLVGAEAAMPLAVAPTGAPGFGRPGADVGIARAAAKMGIPYTLSTSATASIEKIANEAGGRLWFQAYILKRREFTMALIDRAHKAGYEGLMITVDLAVGGKREKDYRNDLSLPFRYTLRNLLDFAMHPRWGLRMLRHGMPMLENLVGYSAGSTTTKRTVHVAGSNYDPGFDWDDIAEVRDRWPGKFIVKGIVHPEDAERAVRLGCDAIVVSNHGGRQLDGTLATADALPQVVDAVGGRASVLVDGGIRRGVDVLKAIALGADGVLVGRATLYGGVVGGEAGAEQALEILKSEFTRSMQLCGVLAVDEINAKLLANTHSWR